MLVSSKAGWMAELSIPSGEFDSFAQIVDLNDAMFAELLGALSQTPPALTHTAYLARLSPKLPSFEQEPTSKILRTIVALYHVNESLGHTPAEITNLVFEAALESPDHKERFTGERAATLKQRLTKLLSLEKTLGLGAKCVALMRRGERTFTKSALTAEMLPILSPNGKLIEGAAIAFDLRIEFIQDKNKRTELYFNLDEDDIQNLKKEIEKAEVQRRQIREYLSANSIFFLNND